jgi:hypothetical protein
MPFCPSCGTKVDEGQRFCPNCGKELPLEKPSSFKPEFTETRGRPAGVALLSILEVLSGIVWVVLAAILLGFFQGFYEPHIWPLPLVINTVAFFLGIVYLVLGFVSFILAYGFWYGIGWAWLVGIILEVMGLILNLIEFPSGLLGLFINILVLYYLTRPHVKRYFGRE